MSHKNKVSLAKQTTDILTGKLRIGQSKRAAKFDGTYTEGIYSFSTLRAYLDHSIRFVHWCKAEHHCKTVEECRQYADEYLKSRFALSAYTVKLDAASIAKLYGCSTTDFVTTPVRHRVDIKRSRNENAIRDKHFSADKNADLVAFCCSTGLRRRELQAIRGTDYKVEDGILYVHVRSGKGGKERWVRAIGDVGLVKNLMDTAGSGKVFPKISSAADIHGYRRDFARAYYDSVARPISDIPRPERYYCRKDLAGIVYDRKAMLEVSRMLGHERVCIAASNYLH